MSLDIDSEMLNALTSDPSEQTERAVPNMPIEEQKAHLIKNTNILPLDLRASIGNVLMVNGLKDSLQSNSEGTIINLDALDDSIISRMYELLLYHLEKMQLK